MINLTIMEHNAEELQEILNIIMQGIMSIITSALMCRSVHCVTLDGTQLYTI